MKAGALALLGIALLLAHSALAQTGATIEGTVTDSVTHAGIADVKVTFSTEEADHYTAATDSSGNFRIAGVEPGEYSTSYVKSGFVQLYLPLPGQSPVRVGVSGTARADAELAAYATLRGRVLDPDGKPATYTSLQLGANAAETDAEGRFVFQELPPGTYTLRAVGQALSPAKVPVAPTYYPSTINEAEAERIAVRGGADLGGYEIRLRTSQVYNVRGVVHDAAGRPLAGAKIRLLTRGEDRLLGGRGIAGAGIQYYVNLHGLMVARPALSHADGTFEFRNVLPGDWSLTAESHHAGESIESAASGIVPVHVSDQDVENVELRCTPEFSLQVTADWGDRQPPGDALPNVMLGSATDVRLLPSPPREPGAPEVFEHLMPGRYRIVPTPGSAPGFYAAAIMAVGRDVLGQEVELNDSTPEIRVVYRPNPGSVRGTVEKGAGATVLLWPEGPVVPAIVRFVQADPHGAFEFSNVAPGSYSVVAFDRVVPSLDMGPFVLGAIAAGTRVSLQEGGAESVQLAVTHWPE